MYRLLIVDDQPDLVDDLAETLPWHELGIEAVYRAYSAREALDIVRTNPVDVVVTDIRMPGMSGLDLMREIRRSWKNIRCILLSGYSDFEYARSGIRHQADDYLLKPVEDEQLLEAVRRALRQLDEQWQQTVSYQNLEATLKEMLPVLQNGLLLDLLQGRIAPSAVSPEKLERLGLSFRIGEPVCLALIRMEEDLHARFGSDIGLLEYAVLKMADEMFSDEFRIWSAKDPYGYLAVAIQSRSPARGTAEPDGLAELDGLAVPDGSATGPGGPAKGNRAAAGRDGMGDGDGTADRNNAAGDADASSRSAAIGGGLHQAGGTDVSCANAPSEDSFAERLERKAAQLQHYVRVYLKGTVSLFIDPQGRFPFDLRDMYDRSVSDFRRLIGSERELLVVAGRDTLARPGETGPLGALHDPPTLVHLLETGQWDALEEKLKNALDIWERRLGGSHEHMLEIYFTFVGALAYSLHNGKRWLEQTLGDDFEPLVRGPNFRTARQFRDWMFRVVGKYRNEVQTETRYSRSNLVRQVQQYVADHLADATLQSIAAHVYLNPSYLSKIYKLETGEGLHEYIQRMKMERAAHWLKCGGMKIYEIAERLGYTKTSYFIKLFRETYGMTPQEYRNSVGK